MRDTLLAVVLVYFFARALSHPWIGILTWTALSIGNLHQLVYFLNSMPVAAATVVVIFLGLLLSREGQQHRSLPMTAETVVFLLFIAWMCVTQVFSFDSTDSFEQWKKVMKIDFMIVMSMVILHSRQHIMALVWVLVASIGYYGLKGGVFTIMTGGAYRVWGPVNSYIQGNNEIGLALVVIIPLIRLVQLDASSRWLKQGLTLLMALCAIAAIGSQSRGALLAILAMGLLLWWRAKGKHWGAVILFTFGLAMFGFMPESWHERMGTIQTYDEDASALGRINAWWMTWNLASHNFFGGGFSIYNPQVFSRYAPVASDVHAAHSIYFQVLGEHGFVGLFLFMLMWVLTWRTAERLRTQGKLQAQTLWLADLGAMCQVSLVGYAVGGAFLSLAYFDLPYNILILVVLGRRWMESKAWLSETAYQAPVRAALGLRT